MRIIRFVRDLFALLGYVAFMFALLGLVWGVVFLWAHWKLYG